MVVLTSAPTAPEVASDKDSMSTALSQIPDLQHHFIPYQMNGKFFSRDRERERERALKLLQLNLQKMQEETEQ